MMDKEREDSELVSFTMFRIEGGLNITFFRYDDGHYQWTLSVGGINCRHGYGREATLDTDESDLVIAFYPEQHTAICGEEPLLLLEHQNMPMPIVDNRKLVAVYVNEAGEELIYKLPTPPNMTIDSALDLATEMASSLSLAGPVWTLANLGEESLQLDGEVTSLLEPQEDIAARLRRLMNVEKIGVNELARRCKVPKLTIHRILAGKSKSPRIENLKKMADTLGVGVSYLAHGSMASAVTTPIGKTYSPINIEGASDSVDMPHQPPYNPLEEGTFTVIWQDADGYYHEHTLNDVSPEAAVESVGGLLEDETILGGSIEDIITVVRHQACNPSINVEGVSDTVAMPQQTPPQEEPFLTSKKLYAVFYSDNAKKTECGLVSTDPQVAIQEAASLIPYLPGEQELSHIVVETTYSRVVLGF